MCVLSLRGEYSVGSVRAARQRPPQFGRATVVPTGSSLSFSRAINPGPDPKKQNSLLTTAVPVVALTSYVLAGKALSYAKGSTGPIGVTRLCD